MTLHGSGFTASSEALGYLQCRLNGTVVRGQLLSGGAAVVCRSASVAAGYVSVEVSTNGLDFTADGVQYESVWSVVSGLAPWSGPVAGGTLVTVSGAGFAASMRLVRCRFGWGELVGASVHSAGEARCVSPPHAATGWVGVELVSLDEVVGGGSFFYEARAYVSLVLPLLGPVEGGTRLTVLGSHFRESSSLACRFGIGEDGGFSVAARFLSSSQLECVSPVVAGASARSVEVSFNGQQFSTGGAAYTYAQAASVSSVWPVQGSAEGGTPLTVHGSGFTAASEALGYLQCLSLIHI